MNKSKKLYKLAFVIPRYNCSAAGGAEKYCQELATNLQSKGHKITILTTKAINHYTWANHYKQNKEYIDGIEVKRFRTNSRDFRKFLMHQERIESKMELTPITEKEWIDNSVNSREMESYIRKNKNNFDYFIFMPYLFGLIYNCSKIVSEKSFLIPCLHDESYAYLNIFKEMFHNVKGILFNAYPEMELAKRIYNLKNNNTSFVGVGVEKENLNLNPDSFRLKYNIKDPFIVFVGRKESGKNFPILLNYFNKYKNQHPSNLKLLILGSGDYNWDLNDKRHVIDLGYVSEEDKMNAIASGLLLCQPSTNESFSIVMMEAWLAKKPVLVHSNCPVTKDHCLRSNGGLYFKDYPEFEECLNYLLTNPEKNQLMGENGNAYVQQNFNWNSIIKRFENALQKNG